MRRFQEFQGTAGFAYFQGFEVSSGCDCGLVYSCGQKVFQSFENEFA